MCDASKKERGTADEVGSTAVLLFEGMVETLVVVDVDNSRGLGRYLRLCGIMAALMLFR